MHSDKIDKKVFEYLNKLEKNNTREWFTENKVEFKSIEAEVKAFYQGLLEDLNTHDAIEKLKMFRIYRDVRFSKDKTPYKTHLGGSYTRNGARLRGGYYLQIKPGNSFVASGFWGPSKEDLFRIRKEFELDASEIRAIIKNPSFKNIWGDIVGDELKTAPKGFDKTHKNIDLIKRKQFVFVRNFTDNEVLSSGFRVMVNDSFKTIRPYFDLMSDILTTNLNGESLIK